MRQTVIVWPTPLSPDTVIEPYDETLNDMNRSNRLLWSALVLKGLSGVVDSGDSVVFLAGNRYREFLVKALLTRGCEVQVPMEGMRIGEQLSWLSQNTFL